MYINHPCHTPAIPTYNPFYLLIHLRICNEVPFCIITDLLTALVQIPHHESVNEVSVVKDGVFLYKFVPQAVSVMTTNRYAKQMCCTVHITHTHSTHTRTHARTHTHTTHTHTHTHTHTYTHTQTHTHIHTHYLYTILYKLNVHRLLRGKMR